MKAIIEINKNNAIAILGVGVDEADARVDAYRNIHENYDSNEQFQDGQSCPVDSRLWRILMQPHWADTTQHPSSDERISRSLFIRSINDAFLSKSGVLTID